jgi:hypothetical protein
MRPYQKRVIWKLSIALHPNPIKTRNFHIALRDLSAAKAIRIILLGGSSE